MPILEPLIYKGFFVYRLFGTFFIIVHAGKSLLKNRFQSKWLKFEIKNLSYKGIFPFEVAMRSLMGPRHEDKKYSDTILQ